MPKGKMNLSNGARRFFSTSTSRERTPMREAVQGMNVARIASLRAGLPVEVSAMTINRFCASGLQAIALAAERIRGGGADVIVAGGTESMSMVPLGGNKISLNPPPVE